MMLEYGAEVGQVAEGWLLVLLVAQDYINRYPEG